MTQSDAIGSETLWFWTFPSHGAFWSQERAFIAVELDTPVEEGTPTERAWPVSILKAVPAGMPVQVFDRPQRTIWVDLEKLSAIAAGVDLFTRSASLSAFKFSTCLRALTVIAPGRYAGLLPASLQSPIRHLLGFLERQASSPDEDIDESDRVLVGLVLIALVTRVILRTEVGATLLTARAGSDPLHRALSFVESNFRRPIGIRDIAKAANRSPAYLTHLAKRTTGKTLAEWLTHRRMAEAAALLTDTEMLIQDIAVRVGYLDSRHFSRLFKSLFDVSPKDWRRRSPQASLPKGTPKKITPGD